MDSAIAEGMLAIAFINKTLFFFLGENRILENPETQSGTRGRIALSICHSRGMHRGSGVQFEQDGSKFEQFTQGHRDHFPLGGLSTLHHLTNI